MYALVMVLHMEDEMKVAQLGGSLLLLCESMDLYVGDEELVWILLCSVVLVSSSESDMLSESTSVLITSVCPSYKHRNSTCD